MRKHDVIVVSYVAATRTSNDGGTQADDLASLIRGNITTDHVCVLRGRRAKLYDDLLAAIDVTAGESKYARLGWRKRKKCACQWDGGPCKAPLDRGPKDTSDLDHTKKFRTEWVNRKSVWQAAPADERVWLDNAMIVLSAEVLTRSGLDREDKDFKVSFANIDIPNVECDLDLSRIRFHMASWRDA